MMTTPPCETYYHTLDNGIRIVYQHTDSPVAYVGLMVGAGTRDEDPDTNGMAHYIEHCVFKGTRDLTAGAIINKVEDVGGDINAYTTKEDTTFYAATLTNHIGRITSLLKQMVFLPTFPKKETDKEMGVILDEIESYNDSPSELIYDDFENIVFDQHSLSMPILGTRKTLRHINSQKALDFMSRCYNTDNIVYFCRTEAPWHTVLHIARRYLDDIPERRRCFKRQAPQPMKAGAFEYRRHTHQIHVMLGGRAYPLTHPMQMPFYLLHNILGGSSLSSMLNLNLRERHGLVYTIESNYTPLSDTGYWSIYYAAEKEHIEQCNQLVEQTLRQLRDNPIPDSRLRKYKQRLRGQMAIAAQNQENNALAMAKNMLYFNHAPLWTETFERIEQTTARQLQDLANELLCPANTTYLYYL